MPTATITAADLVLLAEARASVDEAARAVFLIRADALLKYIWDMTDEYRGMVGDGEDDG